MAMVAEIAAYAPLRCFCGAIAGAGDGSPSGCCLKPSLQPSHAAGQHCERGCARNSGVARMRAARNTRGSPGEEESVARLADARNARVARGSSLALGRELSLCLAR